MRSQLADYRLLQPLDAEAGGTPRWLAEPPPRLGEGGPVVISELPDVDEDSWPAIAGRLGRVAAVSSPNLVRLIEAGRTPDGSESVAWFSRSRGPLRPLTSTGPDQASALRALAGAARGLAALHDAGCVHGGIRAATILVGSDGGMLDAPGDDYGLGAPVIARVMRTADLDGVEPDALWGTGPTATSDLYALAAAAHVVLTSRLVHPALATDQPVTAVQRVLFEPPSLAPGLDGRVADLLSACLATDPAQRPPTAAVLSDRFDQLGAAL